MKFTLGTAAKAAKVSKSTILRALDDRRMSGEKNEKGHWQIDPSEVDRVFGLKIGERSEPFGGTLHKTTMGPPERNGSNTSDTFALERIIEAHEATIADLRERLDREAEERRSATRLLTHQKRGFLERLGEVFRKKNG